MSRIAYVNGCYIDHAHAAVSIEDRGFQFADSIYEVIAVINGRLIDADDHLDRLDRSLEAIRLANPLPRTALLVIFQQVIRQNRLQNGNLYLQITRGVAHRAFYFPTEAHPCVVVTARAFDQSAFLRSQGEGVKTITVPDTRWKQPYIKSTALLASVLAKQQAVEAGAYEAIFVNDQGYITEGSSANLWIVNASGVIQTHPEGQAILSGITRSRLLSLCQQANLPVLEKPFTVKELYQAKEAFLSASNSYVMPIIMVDQHNIGDGKTGTVTSTLQNLYMQFVLKK
ncbi:MAG: D-amino-acid transaminase [Alphaproteobacteria bacterium]